MEHTTHTNRHWKVHHDEAGIAWLHLDMADSSANLLSSDVIDELGDILYALALDLPKAVVFRSDKKNGFIFGADIREFTTLENSEQALDFIGRGQTLMDKIEALSCPSVSMISGACLGGGVELALACDYIVVSDEPSTKLGLPEIKLGIHPGYGGTERSIRRCGPLAAMDLMLTGRSVSSYTAKKIGLIDEVAPLRQLEHAARWYALNTPSRKRLSLSKRLLNTRLLRPLIANRMHKQVSRKARPEHYPAPYGLIRLWRDNYGDSRRMLQQEAISVAELATTDSARNLVRVFLLSEELKSKGKQIEYKAKHVHVIGGGIMGGDIASWCAIQGYRVTVQDQDPARLAAMVKRAHESFGKKFKRDRRAIVAASDRLMPDLDGVGVARADIVIEAIFEDAEIKRKLYQAIEPRMKADAILATNTSSIRLEDLAPCLQQPGRLVGLHFFNPVALMPLVEVIRGEQTHPMVMNKTLAFGRGIGKLPLPVKSSPGFLVNRILMPYLLEAVIMIGEGIAPEVIDRAATDFGMPMGPIELADSVGLDICWSVATILSQALNLPLPDSLKKLTESNRLGKKSGEGFYRYRDGKAQKNTSAKYNDMQTVQDRLVLRLLHEATACLRDGIVESENMVDAGVIFGTGFAPFTGGAINYIRSVGADPLCHRMGEMQQRFGERFDCDATWAKL